MWDAGSAAGAGDYGPFGDAESRAFYEDLPDLLAMVPLSALGLTPEQVTGRRLSGCVECSMWCLLFSLSLSEAVKASSMLGVE